MQFDHPNTPVTSAIIKKIIQDKMENTSLPRDVYYWLIERTGQKFTQRDADALTKKFGTKFRIEKIAGMTNLKWGKTKDFYGFNFLIAYAVVNVVIPDSTFFHRHNAAYLTAAVERNGYRTALLKDTKRLSRIARAIKAYRKGCDEIDDALGDSYDFNTDRNIMEKLAINKK